MRRIDARRRKSDKTEAVQPCGAWAKVLLTGAGDKMDLPGLSADMDVPIDDIRELRGQDLTELRGWLETASIIFAVQRGNPKNRSLVFGRAVLQAIVQGIVPPLQMRVVGVAIDFKSDELEKLCAVVQVVKGCHEHEFLPGDGPHKRP